MTATTADSTSERLPTGGLVVEDLGVMLTGKDVDVVDDIDLVLKPGEVVGLVGESGSGKTTVGTSLLGYSRAGAFISSGKVLLEERDVLSMHWREMRQVRGEEIAYVPQDPASALNPSIRIGKQIVELLELRGIGTSQSRLQGARDGLAEVGLPNDDEFLSRYAHQLSGGQVQRVALAMAFLPKPKVLVLDEPTTGLDVTTQAMVLETMAALCKSHGVSALYVTHDLAVVANIADRVAVMYAGQIVELGPRDAMFRNPSHPYTRALLDSIPHLSQARALTGIPGRTPAPGRPAFRLPLQRPVLLRDRRVPQRGAGAARRSRRSTSVRCIRAEEIGTWDISRGTVPDADPDKAREVILSVEGLNVFYGQKHVVHDVSFDLAKAEVVALVGESGSGKTTISRSIGGLHKDWTGTISFEGDALAKGARQRSALNRKRLQYIFQNPYLSLNPRLTIEQIVKRPMELFGIASGKDATDRAVDLLDQVALGPRMLRYQASRLSGGERQRVAIARALAAEPDVMICDEITSALDVSVQGSIVELLEGLRQSRGISMVFVTHNLALVRSIAARVEILQAGRVVEAGPVVEVMDNPRAGVHPQPARQQSQDRLAPACPRARLGPGSRGSCSSTPRTTRRGRTTSCARVPSEELPTASRPLEVQVAGAGTLWDLESWRDATHTTSLLVVEGGAVVHEWYADGLGPTPCSSAPRCRSRRWPTWSAAPCATGHLGLDDEVCAHVPELEGTGYARRARGRRADDDLRRRLGRGPPRPRQPGLAAGGVLRRRRRLPGAAR